MPRHPPQDELVIVKKCHEHTEKALDESREEASRLHQDIMKNFLIQENLDLMKEVEIKELQEKEARIQEDLVSGKRDLEQAKKETDQWVKNLEKTLKKIKKIERQLKN